MVSLPAENQAEQDRRMMTSRQWGAHAANLLFSHAGQDKTARRPSAAGCETCRLSIFRKSGLAYLRRNDSIAEAAHAPCGVGHSALPVRKGLFVRHKCSRAHAL